MIPHPWSDLQLRAGFDIDLRNVLLMKTAAQAMETLATAPAMCVHVTFECVWVSSFYVTGIVMPYNVHSVMLLFIHARLYPLSLS